MKLVRGIFAVNSKIIRLQSGLLNRIHPIENSVRWKDTATAAFGIATICLGVENSDLKKEKKTTQSPPTTTTTTTTSSPPIDMEKYRLPGNVVPKLYDLYLYPNLGTGLFKGTVTAHVDVLEETSEIVLHSNQLNITSVEIDSSNGEFQLDPKYELLNIKSGQTLKAGEEHQIKITFEGSLTKGIVGFYQSTYTNNAGLPRNIATSKFEPTYARQAYPCFDEPQYKAKYKVHLLKPKDASYIALSNNPEEASEDVEDGVLVHFQETVPMSTYLACFLVCDFEYDSTTFKNKDNETELRVYVSPGQKAKAAYALDVGATIMAWYVDYFNIPYPLPKLDMAAIPDFVSGAMEHWGLVTYRQTSLLYSADTHSSANQQRVAEVVAHELAHSWFGNLVTMNWWNNLWLNEGFATYIEYKGVNAHHPEWNMMDQFIINTLQPILYLDATAASHAIIKNVETPDQITEVFDTISYSKGASILRMLESAIGEVEFATAVTNYLNQHAYGNAVSDDLWKQLQEVVGTKVNVKNFMDTFTKQMGYPVVDVKINGTKCVLTQRRFVLDKASLENASASEFDYKWSIPISYATNLTGHSEIYWFNNTQTELEIDLPSNYDWIKFNPNQIGYYRVNYETSVWENLIENIGKLSTADKTHLLEESFSLAYAGDLPYETALNLTQFLANEREYLLWACASGKFLHLAMFVIASPGEQQLYNYVNDLLSTAYDELGWDELPTDSHLMKRTRVAILSLACAFNNKKALEKARDLFHQWLAAPEKPISPNLRATVYKYGMIEASIETWNTMFDRFHAESDASEKLKLLHGLANVRDPSLLHRLIDLAKTEEYIRGQDYFTALSYISGNPVGTSIVWDYVRENWGALVERFTLNDRYLGRLIPSITGSFTTSVKLSEIEQFFSDNPEAGAGAGARQEALENVRNNINWVTKYKASVEQWLQSPENKMF